jgi:cyclic beta-1,2-glucan synthetase
MWGESMTSSRSSALNRRRLDARLLSNGRYSVLVSASGGGFSAWRGIALTPWRPDRTLDAEGIFVYLRDLDDGTFWSATARPLATEAKYDRASADAGCVMLARTHHGIEAATDVCVVPDTDVEIRRVTLRNHSSAARRIEVTTYIELALAEPAAFAAHPAFRKLFVQTELDAPSGVLLAHRRPRAADEAPLWVAHALSGEGSLEWETDRARFVGRGLDLRRPAALTSREPLSGSVGSVLDPILSGRRVVRLPPGATAQLAAVLAVAETRAAARDGAQRNSATSSLDRAFERARDTETERRRELGLSDGAAEKLSTLAGAILYGDSGVRPDANAMPNGPGCPDLVRLGLRADVPFAVVRIPAARRSRALRTALCAQRYWSRLGLAVDLLAIAESASACDEALRQAGADATNGRVAKLGWDDVEPGVLNDILAAAACTLPPVAARPSSLRRRAQRRVAYSPCLVTTENSQSVDRQPLLFDNGYGGFCAAGSEYVIRLPSTANGPRRPPQPWVNVIANEQFGFLVSESGAGCTWSRNSRENRLTPWSNDPISDPHDEALYLRDEDRGVFWSPLPGPCPGPNAYEASHGFGYSRWQHACDDLGEETCFFVARSDPVKVMRVRLSNRGTQERHLSVFCYLRLVLGTTPAESGRFVETWTDAASGAVFARNRFRGVFSDGICFASGFASSGAEAIHVTADREAFIGRNGSMARPAALQHDAKLDGRTGASLDPCVALQIIVRIPAGGSVDCVFLLGEADSEERSRSFCRAYATADRVEAELEEVRGFWRQLVSVVQVVTPRPAIDLMLNGWLLYQVMSCRLWGRSAFYQSGGAFGFRDQLQDSTALLYSDPARTRAQILLHAAHQFDEGDVLHWWHPPGVRGIRTRFSDDLLWLPFVTCFYVRVTGDGDILNERLPFLTDRRLASGEDEAFLMPRPADAAGDLYAHCCLTIDRSLAAGAHGLPRMGTGDWNDGMNRVGCEGRGESVWMGFFLYEILGEFSLLCDQRGDHGRAQSYRTRRAELAGALEAAGWDGEWYRRAYYDDGTPLGSAENDECRIDALAQAWAVLSGAAPRERAEQAMDAVEERLVNESAGLIHLLTPPFDRTEHDPGYIKGYVPGIRENGGQYTHAALWVVRALAHLGRRHRAAPLLEMLSPVSHGATAERVATYRVEPYVVAADVYGVEPHLGRGGWTWYTGSAAWMYRVGLESILGFQLEGGDRLCIRPCVPDAWPEFRITYRLPNDNTCYEIHVRNPTGRADCVVAADVDGEPVPVSGGAATIGVHRDGQVHRVSVVLGRERPSTLSTGEGAGPREAY